MVIRDSRRGNLNTVTQEQCSSTLEYDALIYVKS